MSSPMAPSLLNAEISDLMETKDIVSVIVNAFVSLIICVITIKAADKRQSKQSDTKLKDQHDEVKNKHLIDGINKVNEEFVEAMKTISEAYLMLQIQSEKNDSAWNKITDACNKTSDFQYVKYKNNLFMTDELRSAIDRAFEFLVDELEVCVNYYYTNTENKSDIADSSSNFTKKAEEFLSRFSKLLDKEISYNKNQYS